MWNLRPLLKDKRIKMMYVIKLIFWFFSNLVGEEGSRIPGFRDSRVCFPKTLSAFLTFKPLTSLG